jgi:hypothetical protein
MITTIFGPRPASGASWSPMFGILPSTLPSWDSTGDRPSIFFSGLVSIEITMPCVASEPVASCTECCVVR